MERRLIDLLKPNGIVPGELVLQKNGWMTSILFYRMDMNQNTMRQKGYLASRNGAYKS